MKETFSKALAAAAPIIKNIAANFKRDWGTCRSMPGGEVMRLRHQYHLKLAAVTSRYCVHSPKSVLAFAKLKASERTGPDLYFDREVTRILENWASNAPHGLPACCKDS